ncbi:restriction endonuclease subunit S [Acidithiobacillus albertensis]|uniref:restriction endonuclease subunit S n=1 Tax=Acidithiobacillus albertensis TaxID=119978 RepID=UPI00094B1281|nr:restriction endonuclease subunit S [Acidithiobacillus albertensis]
MSELPHGWVTARLPDLVGQQGVFVDGDWVESKDQDPHGEVRLVQLADIGDGRFLNKSNRYLTQVKATELGCTFLEKGDVLIARMPDPLGRACIFPGDKKRAVTVVDVCVVRGKGEGFDHAWLMHFVNSAPFRESIHSLQSGSTRKRISRGNLSTLELPVPPRKEQTRIVEKLEELLSDLDAGVAELKAAQKKLAQYRQSLLKAAVEGTLTAEWRQQHPPAETGAQLLQRILTQRRARWEAKQLAKLKQQGKTPPKDWQKKYPEPVQPDTSGLPELPQEWVWASGEQLCEFITKGTTPPKGLDAGKAQTIPFLRVTNLTDEGRLDLTDRVYVSEETHTGFLARSVVYPKDVLMNIVGPPLGQVSVVPNTFPEWNINQAIAIFRAVDGVMPEFVCAHLLSPIAQQWLKAKAKTTAGQTNLTLEVCRALPFPFPPQNEHQSLVLHLEETLAVISVQAEAIEIALKQSAAQRQNILRAAFAGQLVPQDPADEPASVLLARIRAERAERDTLKTPRRSKAKEPA